MTEPQRSMAAARDGSGAAEVAGLQAVGLGFRYGERGGWQLQDVTVSVRPGELLGLVGPNGAGKTTLLRLLAGILPPREGIVRAGGRPLATLAHRERARLLAFVPQESRPAFDIRVADLVLLGRAPHLGWMGIEGARDLAIAREALEETGALPLANRSFGTLSAGEKQRAVLARALAQQAPVVLLDEPTAFLDLAHQVRLYELLSRLRAARRTTFVVASHDLTLAGRHCDRLLLLKDGRVLAEGTPRDVLTPETIRQGFSLDADVLFPAPQSGPVIVPRTAVSDNT